MLTVDIMRLDIWYRVLRDSLAFDEATNRPYAVEQSYRGSGLIWPRTIIIGPRSSAKTLIKFIW